MSISKHPSTLTSVFAEASTQWLSACLQPWSAVSTWNAFWGERWQEWLSVLASAPNPWLPALADERDGQPAAIDFFLPWLPRGEVVSGQFDSVGEKDVVRAMRRAAAPHVGGASGGVADVEVKAGTTGEAGRSQSAAVRDDVVAEVAPTPSKAAKAPSPTKARRKPAPKPVAEVAKEPAPKRRSAATKKAGKPVPATSETATPATPAPAEPPSQG